MKPIFISLSLLFLFSNCQTPEMRMEKFISSYNSSFSPSPSPSIISSSAIKKSPTWIQIDFKLDMSFESLDGDLLDGMYPDMVCHLISSMTSTEKLLDDGVRFDVVFYARDGEKINNLVVNKNRLERLKNKVDQKAENNPTLQETGHLNKNQKNLLHLVNGNFPFYDPTTDITTTRVEIDEDYNLVYYLRTPEYMISDIGDTTIQQSMLSEMIDDPETGKLFQGIQPLGLQDIIYMYVDSNENLAYKMIVPRSHFY